MPSLTSRLVGITRRPVAASDREVAAAHVLDWAAACVSAESTGSGRTLRAFATAAPAGPCFTFASGSRDAYTAAFVNSGLGIALEMDSTSRTAKVHPGPVVIAAALACAQREGATGAAFLDAVVRGYEAMIRLGEAVGPAHYVSYHSTSTCGPVGSAVAAAVLLGLDVDATLDAVGNALSRTGGVWQCRPERTMTKLIHVGESTGAGLRSADLARLGLTGPRYVLEGDLGLFPAACPDPDLDAVDRDADGPWKIRATSLKPWPGCRHAHPAVTVALRLRDELEARDVPLSVVESVNVSTYPEAIAFTDCPEPSTEADAMFSTQHLLARAATRDADAGRRARRGARVGSDTRAGAEGDLSAGDDHAARYPAALGSQSARAMAGRRALGRDRRRVRGSRGPDEQPGGQREGPRAARRRGSGPNRHRGSP